MGLLKAMPDPGVLSGPGSLVVVGMDRRSMPTLGLLSGWGTVQDLELHRCRAALSTWKHGAFPRQPALEELLGVLDLDGMSPIFS